MKMFKSVFDKDNNYKNTFEKSNNYQTLDTLKSEYTKKFFVIFNTNKQIGNYIVYCVSDFVGLKKNYNITNSNKVLWTEIPFKCVSILNK